MIDRFMVCYSSEVSSWVEKNDLEFIMQTTMINNTELNVSGLLLEGSGLFFQIIEGKKNDVLSVYSKIKKDSRHHSIQEIFNCPIDYPIFKNYDCKFTILRSSDDYTRIEESFNVNNIYNYKEKILRLLKPFYLAVS